MKSKKFCNTSKKKPTFYVVLVGRQPGIYRSWHLVEQLVSGYGRNSYRKYHSYEEAKAALDRHPNGLYDSKKEFKYDPQRPPRGSRL